MEDLSAVVSMYRDALEKMVMKKRGAENWLSVLTGEQRKLDVVYKLGNHGWL